MPLYIFRGFIFSVNCYWTTNSYFEPGNLRQLCLCLYSLWCIVAIIGYLLEGAAKNALGRYINVFLCRCLYGKNYYSFYASETPFDKSFQNLNSNLNKGFNFVLLSFFQLFPLSVLYGLIDSAFFNFVNRIYLLFLFNWNSFC